MKLIKGTSVLLDTPATHVCMGFHRLTEVIILDNAEFTVTVCMRHMGKHYHLTYDAEDIATEIAESQTVYECAGRIANTAAYDFLELDAKDRLHHEVTSDQEGTNQP